MRVGIEIEAAVASRTAPRGGWGWMDHQVWTAPNGARIRCGSDASIRDIEGLPVELKCDGPTDLRDVWRWLEGVKAYFDAFRGATNHTCGVHVHVSYADLTQIAGVDRSSWNKERKWLAAFVAHAARDEMAYFAAGGTSRRFIRHYCRPLKRTSREMFTSILRSSSPSSVANSDKFRVVNINHALASPENRKTIEIRAFPSTVEVDRIFAWTAFAAAVNMYHAMKAQARKRTTFPGEMDEQPFKMQGAEGPFLALINRMFYMTGWTRGKTKRPPLAAEIFTPEGAPSMEAVKKTLRKLAADLDERLYGPQSHSQMRLIEYLASCDPERIVLPEEGYSLGRWSHRMHRTPVAPGAAHAGWKVVATGHANSEQQAMMQELAAVIGAEYVGG